MLPPASLWRAQHALLPFAGLQVSIMVPDWCEAESLLAGMFAFKHQVASHDQASQVEFCGILDRFWESLGKQVSCADRTSQHSGHSYLTVLHCHAVGCRSSAAMAQRCTSPSWSAALRSLSWLAAAR